MSYKKFMDTLNKIYLDVSVFKSRIRDNLPITDDMVVQTLEDYEFAGDVAQFIRRGDYLGEGVRADNARKLLSTYKFGNSGSVSATLNNLSRRQVYSVSDMVESALDIAFPNGLRYLWDKRDFEGIRLCMQADASNLSIVLDGLEKDGSTIDFISNLYSMSSMMTTETVRRSVISEDPKELSDSCVRAMGVISEVMSLIDNSKSDIYSLVLLRKALSSQIAIPIGLYNELVNKNALGLFDKLEPDGVFEEVEL